MKRLVQRGAVPAMKTEQQKQQRDPRSDRSGVIVPFPVRKPVNAQTPAKPTFSNLSTGTLTGDKPPVDGIDKYAKRGPDQDDYAHRMKMNALAVVLLTALVAGGVWIVDVMAQQRKNQDCVLSGRRNCALISPAIGK